MNCTYAADIMEQAAQWLEEGRSAALATIVSTVGSSSRPLGTRMLCTDGDEFAGAVSGGCVETDVCRIAREVLARGIPRIIHYGPVKDSILEVGLNCDGTIDVLVEPLDSSWIEQARKPFLGVVTMQCGLPEKKHSGYQEETVIKRTWYPREMPYGAGLVRDAWEAGSPRSTRTAAGLLLAEPVMPAPCLIIFGAGPIADDLARMARIMGYTTVISDPRESRFGPGPSPADRISVEWPRETLSALQEHQELIPSRTYIVSLEHEPRFEDALWSALIDEISGDAGRRPVYIGAIGKAQRAIEREERARRTGTDLSPLYPIHTPVGLDIGGKASPEVALSILAQIVATVHGRPGGFPGALRPVAPGN